MPSCDEFVELVTAYLEGQLEPETERGFLAHLAGCDGCGRYLEQLRATIRALGQPRPESISDEARERLLTAFRSAREVTRHA